MATLLAKNKKGKGVIIFTHNELEYFFPYLLLPGLLNKSKKSIFFKLIYFIYLNFNKIIKKNILKKISNLKKNFLIGIHWGFDVNYIPDHDFIDFHLGFKKIQSLTSKKFIDLTSRNFSSEYMTNNHNFIKYWDFISVSSNQQRKNIIKILQDFRKIYDLGLNYKLLILIPSTANEKNDKQLIDFFFNNFSFDERNNISIIKLDYNLGFLGLSQKQLSLFYKMSKIYISYSESEGEPRTIHEAQLCGLPIVFYLNQLGGGADYLSDKNAIFFNNFNNSYKSIIKSYNEYDQLKLHTTFNMENKNDTKKNIERLKKSILNIFFDKNLSTEHLVFINFDYLNLRLPTHLYEYNSDIDFLNASRYSTGNITNYKSLNKFIKFINLQ